MSNATYDEDSRIVRRLSEGMYKSLLNNKYIIHNKVGKKLLYLIPTIYIQPCTQIIRPPARFYFYDNDLRKTNYLFK